MIEDFALLFGPGGTPGYLSAEDIPAIELLCKKIKPNGILVEVGCFLGKSSVEWAKNLPESKIICIDGFNSPYHVLKQLLIQGDFRVPQGLNNQLELFKHYTKNYKNIFAIEGFFNKTFGFPGKADFVFEDSTHTQESIWRLLCLFGGNISIPEAYWLVTTITCRKSKQQLIYLP